jgi:hypothetical protein
LKDLSPNIVETDGRIGTHLERVKKMRICGAACMLMHHAWLDAIREREFKSQEMTISPCTFRQKRKVCEFLLKAKFS